MNEHNEYQLRRRAIRLTLQGRSAQAILARIPRSPAWLSKWQPRFAQFGWQSLRSRFCAPLHQRRRYSQTLAAVRRAAPQFVHFYMERYHPPALKGQTPRQAAEQVRRRQLTAEEVMLLPKELPLTAGRLHFVRLVTAQGEITLLNERWSVGKRLAGQYVWATITTHRRRLTIYHRQSERAQVRLVREFRYALREQVLPLAAPFQRPYRRGRMFTMWCIAALSLLLGNI